MGSGGWGCKPARPFPKHFFNPNSLSMKNFLLSVLFALGAVGAAFAQQGQINPLNGNQGLYIDINGHSVPYFLAYPNNGVTTVVLDPSTSVTDQNNCFRHLQRASAQVRGAPVPVLAVLPNIVNTNTQVSETRVVVPFPITASTTLTTIPFSVGQTLQTNGHYRFVARLYLNTGGGGSKFDVGGTCNTSNFVASYRAISTTTILYGGQLTSFLSGPSGSSTAATYLEISGELDVTNGGTFVIQFAQNASNATPSVVLAGSTLTVTQIP